MPRMTQAEYVAHEERVARMKSLAYSGESPHVVAASNIRETGRGGLHAKIMEYCNTRYPRWKFIHTRTDRKSTIEVGAPDFVIFLPGGKTICVEVKSAAGKLSPEQRNWAFEMKRLGHEVHVVRSLAEFLELTNSRYIPPSTDIQMRHND